MSLKEFGIGEFEYSNNLLDAVGLDGEELESSVSSDMISILKKYYSNVEIDYNISYIKVHAVKNPNFDPQDEESKPYIFSSNKQILNYKTENISEIHPILFDGINAFFFGNSDLLREVGGGEIPAGIGSEYDYAILFLPENEQNIYMYYIYDYYLIPNDCIGRLAGPNRILLKSQEGQDDYFGGIAFEEMYNSIDPVYDNFDFAVMLIQLEVEKANGVGKLDASNIFIDGETIYEEDGILKANGGSTFEVETYYTSGTRIARIEVDDESYDIYCQVPTLLSTTLTLYNSNWNNNKQTLFYSDIKENSMIFIKPTDNEETYSSCNIRPSKQLNGQIEFECDTVPSSNIGISIICIKEVNQV